MNRIDSDQPDLCQRFDKDRSELDHLIDELLASERDYISDLRLCQSAYITPLSDFFDLSRVFINWDQLIGLHETSLEKILAMSNSLQKTPPTSSSYSLTIDYYRSIFDDFQQLFETTMESYIEFCTHQTDNTRKLESRVASDLRFKQLVGEAQRNLRRSLEQQQVSPSSTSSEHLNQINHRAQRNLNLSLASFILKPMQRITKYSLLFDRITKVILKEGPEELEDRAERLKLAAQLLCHHVNEACRVREDYEENKTRLRWAQSHIIQTSTTAELMDSSRHTFSSPTIGQQSLDEPIVFDFKTKYMGERRLIKAGSLFKSTSLKEIIGFIFSDFLLLTLVKGGGPLREKDLFKSPKARQSYFKFYRDPIMLEDLVVLPQRSPITKSTTNDANTENFWLPSLEVSSISFQDTNQVYNLQALSTQERDIWLGTLNDHSHKAREARAAYYMRRALWPLKRQSTSNSFGRIFVTVLELKLSRNHPMPASMYQDSIVSPDLRRTSYSIYSSSSPARAGVCVMLQLKRLKQTCDLISESHKRETIPLSEPFRTTQVTINSTPAGTVNMGNHTYTIESYDANGRELIRFNGASTQFLLENRADLAFSPDLLDISLLDESKYRETHLLARRRVNVNQLLGFEINSSGDDSLMNESLSGSFSRKQSLRLEANHPVDYLFRLKPTSNARSTPAVNGNGLVTNSEPETTVKLRFHLQLFSDPFGASSGPESSIGLSDVMPQHQTESQVI